LLLHTFAAATQDVSIDALSISIVPPNERGAINGWMQAGMLGGRSLFGGGALLLTAYVGEHAVFALLVAVVWSSMLLLILSPPNGVVETNNAVGVANRWRDFVLSLKDASKQRTTWLGLTFALMSAAGFEAVGAVAGPYLIDKGFTTEVVGWFFGIPVVCGMLGGALLGGYLSDKIGRIRSVALFLLLFVINIVTIALLDGMMVHDARAWSVLLLSSLYFCIGMFTASSYALFMDITDPRLGATQFSAYMGATNGCEAWSTHAVGKLHSACGYPVAFIVMSSISLATLPLFRLLRRVSYDRN
jgi:MFS transporter, PAT family, beta-lactamase induction signal transducer AmpG